MGQKRIFIIGGSGFVGSKLAESFSAAGSTVAYTYSTRPIGLELPHHRINLLDEAHLLSKCIEAFEPDVVIHCAIPKSTGRDVHHRVSVQPVDQISRVVDPSTFVVYFSTNAIFNGGGPHREESLPQVRQDRFNVYGATRAEGERAVLEKCQNALVIRTDTVNGFDLGGVLNPRLREVVHTLQKRQRISRFVDRFITPTLVDNLVDVTVEICSTDFAYRGILHIAGSERVTDYEYARVLAQHLGVSENLVQPQSMEDYPLSPRDNSLDVSRAQNMLQTRLLNVREQLSRLWPDD